mmetsp:Transcript_10938/g.24089  ORF Transcript_10938/g.24089 Transcript_10938/m.24089 type:complete len:205 (+) Transcript_10938:2591-3205(+)
MLAYKPHNGRTSMLMLYSSFGRNLRSGLSMDILNDANVRRSTKMSTKLHLPKTSRPWSILPRRLEDTQDGEASQRKRAANCLAYGHMPENSTIKTARALAPAFHISNVDLAILNSKKPSILNSSPANAPLMLTVPPSDKWPLKKSATFPKMMNGMHILITKGTSFESTNECILEFKSLSRSTSDRCSFSSSNICGLLSCFTQLL